MNSFLTVFYIIIVITIFRSFKSIRAIMGNTFEKLQKSIDSNEYESLIKDVGADNRHVNIEDKEGLDDFLKSNTNPIKEKSKKRSKF